MSKTGKIVSVAAFVLALAVAVCAFFEWKQTQAHAARYAKLANSAASVAKALDSGSGVGAKISYGKDEKGKETGTLGWATVVGKKFLPAADDVSQAEGSAIAPLEGLAQNVIAQREAIIEGVIEKVAGPLQCPAENLPDADALNNLNDYETGLDSFAVFVKARVTRDNNLKNQINTVLRQMGVRGSYSAAITANGEFSSADKQAFLEGAKNLGSLQSNYSLMCKTLQNFSAVLNASSVSGVTWNSTGARFGGTGLSDSDTKANQAAVAQFASDFEQLKKQLARIDQLEEDKLSLQEEIIQLNRTIDEWKDKYEQDEEVLRSYYRQGLGMNYSSTDKEVKTAYEQVKSDLSGAVLKTDAKYGYVVVNLTECDVIPELRLAIYRNGVYLGLVRVLSTTQFNSLAVVEDGDVNLIQAGDTVVVAGRSLQPAEF